MKSVTVKSSRALRPPQHVTRFPTLEARVHRHEPRADAVDRETGNDPLADVRRPDRDAVTMLYAAGDERAGGDVHAFAELGERPPVVTVDDRFVVGKPSRGVVDELGNGDPGSVRAWT